MARRFPVILGVALMTACAGPGGGVGPRAVGFGEAPHPVGTLHHERVRGCYLAKTQAIIAIDDAWVVMHEIKHSSRGAGTTSRAGRIDHAAR